LVDVIAQRSLSGLLSSSRAQMEKLESEKRQKAEKAEEAFYKYYEQGGPRKSDHQTDLMEIFQI